MKNTIILMCLLPLLIACAETAQKEYAFGAVLPLTGTTAFYGEYAKYGVELAIEDINKAGGINGRTVRIIYEDSASDKTKATNAGQKLIDIDKIDALFTITTPMGGALAPLAEENKVPFIYGSSTNSFAINKTFVFKDYPDFSDACELITKAAVNQGKKIALFGTNAEFTKLCKKGAERVTSLEAFEVYNSGETDFKTQFTKIKSSGNTALILSVFAGDCKHAFKQIRELGLNMQLLFPGQSFTCGSDENTKDNKDLFVNGLGSDVKIDENDPDFVSFKQRLEQRGWTTFIRGSAMMYDSVMTMAKAYENCQDTLCVVNNLRSMSDFKGVTGTLGYHGDTIVERELVLTKFDGMWKS